MNRDHDTEDYGTKEKITGNLKQAEGKLTGDKTRENQGKAEELLGKAKEKVTETVEKAKDLLTPDDEEHKK